MKHAMLFVLLWMTIIYLIMARYTRTPVTSHIMRTDTVAPKTSALCQPKDIFWDLGLAAIQMANKEMRKEAKSVSMWAASVAMAKELLNTPPTISAIMKRRHSPAAVMSFRRALKVKKN